MYIHIYTQTYVRMIALHTPFSQLSSVHSKKGHSKKGHPLLSDCLILWKHIYSSIIWKEYYGIFPLARKNYLK